jgi:hypothetical protein
VFNSLSGASFLANRAKYLAAPVAGVALTSGFAVFANLVLPAYSFEGFDRGETPIAQTATTPSSLDSTTSSSAIFSSAIVEAVAVEGNPPQANASQPIEDGVYLYGQSPERDQIGSAYMVFEVEQGQVVGAFYMPYSSFDCFHGNLQADQLALTVVDSYERTQHPYAVGLEPADALAATESGATPVGLEGFHAIENPSENDLEILSTCRSDFQ